MVGGRDFRLLQFLGQKVSSAVDGTGSFHSYNACGWHGEDFAPEPARGLFVTRVNAIVARYGEGWQMRPDFEVVERAPTGTAELLTVKLPPATGADTRQRVHNAVAKFRRRTSSRDDRRDAVRDLGDVLERLRKDATKHLSRKDESELFKILNNFDIRHNNELQKSDYDTIWLSGLFYHFLTMIHVLTHLIDRDERNSITLDPET